MSTWSYWNSHIQLVEVKMIEPFWKKNSCSFFKNQTCTYSTTQSFHSNSLPKRNKSIFPWPCTIMVIIGLFVTPQKLETAEVSTNMRRNKLIYSYKGTLLGNTKKYITFLLKIKFKKYPKWSSRTEQIYNGKKSEHLAKKGGKNWLGGGMETLSELWGV